MLAVEITRPYNPGLDGEDGLDLAITFVDWAPQAPDFQGGLIDTVLISITGPLSLRYPLAATSLVPRGGTTASVNLSVQVTNHASTSVSGVLIAALVPPGGGRALVNVSQQVTLSAGEVALVSFTPGRFPSLVLANAPLWWPYEMGAPTRLTLVASITVVGGPGQPSDALVALVGLRETSSSIDASGHLQLSVNGLPVLIRGGGWAPDLFLRVDHARLLAELGLNAIRLEGKFVPDAFFDECDARGLMTLPGICCCDSWQRWPQWTAESYEVANASMRSQFARLRYHPSVVAFFTSSDQLPPLDVETMYAVGAAAEAFPNPLIAAASAATSKLSGPTGVKMSGPYSYVPPNYWLEGAPPAQSRVGGAFGFLTEGG